MSYSRWTNSYWYTYWCAHPESSEIRDEQLFAEGSYGSFTYEELKNDLKGCLEKVKKKLRSDDDIYPTNKQLRELKRYMESFMQDIKADKELIDISEFDKISNSIIARGW